MRQDIQHWIHSSKEKYEWLLDFQAPYEKSKKHKSVHDKQQYDDSSLLKDSLKAQFESEVQILLDIATLPSLLSHRIDPQELIL
jgi:hypothetical protein